MLFINLLSSITFNLPEKHYFFYSKSKLVQGFLKGQSVNLTSDRVMNNNY